MAHGRKTYVPRLVKILETGCKYIGRWRYKLEQFLTDGQMLLLDAVLVACDAFITDVTDNPPE